MQIHTGDRASADKLESSVGRWSHAARPRLEYITANIRQRLWANVACGQCRHEMTAKGSKLLLVSKCAECQDDVVRIIESNAPLV